MIRVNVYYIKLQHQNLAMERIIDVKPTILDSMTNFCIDNMRIIPMRIVHALGNRESTQPYEIRSIPYFPDFLVSGRKHMRCWFLLHCWATKAQASLCQSADSQDH